MQDTLQGIQQLVNTPSVMQAVRKMFEDNAELHQKLEALIKEKIASFVETMGSELAVSSDVVARGLNASEIVREAAREIQGGGGGQPFFAMAGGKRPEGLDRAMEAAERLINTKLGR